MGYTLSERDVARLKEMLSWFDNARESPLFRGRGGDDDSEAPEVYVALVPDGGIPALSAPGTSTSTVTLDQLEPGSADCEIYRVVNPSSDFPLVEPIQGLTRRVFNLSRTAITPTNNPFVLAIKDKTGIWWASTGTGGGSTGSLGDCTFVVVTGLCRIGGVTGTAGS